jgi:hypothetical protein
VNLWVLPRNQATVVLEEQSITSLCPYPFPKKRRAGLYICSNVTSLMVVFHLLGGCRLFSTSTNSKHILIHWYPVMYGEMCDENDLKSAIQEICFSTMSLHLFTLLCLSLPFCLIKNDCWYLPSIFIWLSAIWHLIFPRIQGVIKGKMSQWIGEYCCWFSNSRVHKMLWMVVWSLR